jgi:hypothetical protein
LPHKEIRFGSASQDESQWMVTAYSDTDPGSVYLWNRGTKTLTSQYRIREEMPRDALSERRRVGCGRMSRNTSQRRFHHRQQGLADSRGQTRSPRWRRRHAR